MNIPFFVRFKTVWGSFAYLFYHPVMMIQNRQRIKYAAHIQSDFLKASQSETQCEQQNDLLENPEEQDDELSLMYQEESKTSFCNLDAVNSCVAYTYQAGRLLLPKTASCSVLYFNGKAERCQPAAAKLYMMEQVTLQFTGTSDVIGKMTKLKKFKTAHPVDSQTALVDKG